jgi:hypothetical protein
MSERMWRKGCGMREPMLRHFALASPPRNRQAGYMALRAVVSPAVKGPGCMLERKTGYQVSTVPNTNCCPWTSCVGPTAFWAKLKSP